MRKELRGPQKNRARNNLNTHLSRTLSSGVLFYFGSLVKSIFPLKLKYAHA